MDKRQSLFTGTLVLVAASLVNRILGFVYQIFLIRLIKAEGIGLFTMVFPIYVLLLVLASFGIPVAIAKLIADAVALNDAGRVYRLLHLSLVYTVLLSVTVTAAGIGTARFITGQILSNPETHLPFICLLPGVLIVSVCSIFRGFFQGLQYMTPTAVTQTVEQLVRVTVGLFLASVLINRGVMAAACGASLGVVLGEFTGFVLMLVLFLRSSNLLLQPGRLRVRETGYLSREIFRLAFPITLMRLVSTGFLSLDAIIIPHRLIDIGMSTRDATAVYGQFAGVAETLLYTPGLITIALSTALIPAIAEALAGRNINLLTSRVNNALRLTIVTGLPSALVFFFFAEDLCRVVFGYPQAGAALQVLAFGAPFLYLQQTTTGILQGLGRPFVPFRNLVIASIFKVTGIYFLTGIPAYSIRGASAALVIGFLIMSVLNLLDLRKLTGCPIWATEVMVKPAAGMIAATVVLILGYGLIAGKGISTGLNLFYSILSVGAVYTAALIVLGVLKKSDWERLVYIFCKILSAIKK